MTPRPEEPLPQTDVVRIVDEALHRLSPLALAAAQARLGLDGQDAETLRRAALLADEAARALAEPIDELAREPSSIPATDRRIGALRAHAANLTASLARAANAASHDLWTDARDRLELEVEPMLDGLTHRLRRERSLALGPAATQREIEAMIQALRSAATRSEEALYAFEASIVVCAFNKLDYTQLAIDTILEHTDFEPGRFELIVVDNGSRDGTREYVRSIPYARIVELDENTGPLGGFAAGWLAAKGEFIASIANDVVVTRGWLDQLLTCARSDSRIALVVPTCNSISNRQAVPVDYGNDFEAMQRFAALFNRTDPNRWEERCRLMPFAAVLPRRLVDLGFRMDPVYAMGEFVDDDQSTVMRRAGLRQILARDTFVHHFGSVTLGEAQRAETSLERMRTVYSSKWGIDAWEGCRVLPELARIVEEQLPPADARLLMVEPLFGDTLRDVRHVLSLAGRPAATCDALVLDPRYLPDAEVLVENVHQTAETLAADHYDLVLLGAQLEELAPDDPVAFLTKLAPCLRPGGRILARIRNDRSPRELGPTPTPMPTRDAPALGSERPSTPDTTRLALPSLLAELRPRGCIATTVPIRDVEREAATAPLIQMLMSALPHPPNDLAAWLAPYLVLIVEREAASVANP